MKSVFITGGNRGIGLETARQLGKLGYHVIIAGRDEAKVKEAAEKLQKEEGIKKVDFTTIDIEKDASVKAAAAFVSSKTNGVLDVLINNAGWSGSMTGSAINYEDALRCYDINVLGTVRVTTHFLDMVKKSPAGRIVNLSSIMASITMHVAEMSAFPYSASKAALNMYTVTLAKSLEGTAVKVNSAHPGWVKTDMGGPNAELPVEEGAATSVRLATLPEDGPTGGFFFKNEQLPW